MIPSYKFVTFFIVLLSVNNIECDDITEINYTTMIENSLGLCNHFKGSIIQDKETNLVDLLNQKELKFTSSYINTKESRFILNECNKYTSLCQFDYVRFKDSESYIEQFKSELKSKIMLLDLTRSNNWMNQLLSRLIKDQFTFMINQIYEYQNATSKKITPVLIENDDLSIKYFNKLYYPEAFISDVGELENIFKACNDKDNKKTLLKIINYYDPQISVSVNKLSLFYYGFRGVKLKIGECCNLNDDIFTIITFFKFLNIPIVINDIMVDNLKSCQIMGISNKSLIDWFVDEDIENVIKKSGLNSNTNINDTLFSNIMSQYFKCKNRELCEIDRRYREMVSSI